MKLSSNQTKPPESLPTNQSPKDLDKALEEDGHFIVDTADAEKWFEERNAGKKIVEMSDLLGKLSLEKDFKPVKPGLLAKIFKTFSWKK